MKKKKPRLYYVLHVDNKLIYDYSLIKLMEYAYLHNLITERDQELINRKGFQWQRMPIVDYILRSQLVFEKITIVREIPLKSDEFIQE